MISPRSLLTALAFLFLISTVVPAQRLEVPRRHDRPPGPPLSPEEAVARMTVPEGFSVEIVAAEPDVVNPVAMCIDEKGRFWITESFEYPRKEAGPGRDRIKVLEDTDGDGKVDKVTIFAEGLNIPSGIAVGYGGVWVANSPDILFMQDTDGDLKADKIETVVTGFGRTDTHELPNSLTWGPDGWLYGLNGVFNYSDVKYAETNPNFDPQHPGWKFTCAMWRIHPRTREFDIFAEGTSNPWGIAFNDEGEAFISACVIDHLWHVVESAYYIRQGGPYPPHTWPMGSIVEHKHQKAAYCGITWFDSDAYPEEYRKVLYMGNIHGGCINADIVERDGSTYKGHPHPGFTPKPGAWDKDEFNIIAKTGDEKSPKLADLLTANDPWFMPVVQTTGPDGCLYILDWYDRYHCYQDANADPAGIERERGRLYRLRYKDSPYAKPFDLAKKSDDELIEMLGDPNIYKRTTAQRLLTERANPATLPKLDALLFKEIKSNDGDQWSRQDVPKTKQMHALWTRTSIVEPDDAFMQKLARSYRNPLFVAWFYRTAGDSWRDLSSEEWERKVSKMEVWDGTSPLQFAIACGKRGTAKRKIRNAWFTSKSEPFFQQIVWQNMKHALVEEPQEWSFLLWQQEDAEVVTTDNLAPLLARSLEVMVESPKVPGKQIGGVLSSIVGSKDVNQKAREDCVAVVANALRHGFLSKERIAETKESMQEELTDFDRYQAYLDKEGKEPNNLGLRRQLTILRSLWGDEVAQSQIKNIYYDAKVPSPERINALQTLISAGASKEVLSAVSDTINAKEAGPGFRIGVIETVGAINDNKVGPMMAELLVDNLPRFEAEVRPKAIEVLTQRPAWSKPLLVAIKKKDVDKDVLNLNQLRRMSKFDGEEVPALVKELYGAIREGRDPNRDKVIEQVKRQLAEHPGDPIAGEKIFTKVCGQCHKLHGEGAEVGPDITRSGRNSWEQMLQNIFDPSMVIGPGYQARTLITTEGRSLTGLPVEESDQRVVLKIQGGKTETIPRDQIEFYKVSEISMMPEDLEKQLKPQELADLLSYLAYDRKPSDPEAKLLPGAPQPKSR